MQFRRCRRVYSFGHRRVEFAYQRRFGVNLNSCLCGPAYLAAGPFIMAYCLSVFLLETQKEPKRSPLLPIAREARPRGYSPLGTPKMWSRNKKAKPCRSAARFLTLFCFSPSGPSGAKTGRRGRRPLQAIRKLIFGPEGVNMENGPKALRKMQHSCIF